MPVTFLDPTNRPVSETAWAVRTRDGLDGATVGVIWNGRSNGDHVLHEVISRLSQRSGVRLEVFEKKPFIGNVAPQQIFTNIISKQVDFVLAGVGD